MNFPPMLFLRKKAEESLAGRIFLFQLPVLNFSEFIRLKGDGEMIRNPDMFTESLHDQTLQYVKRQLPELVTADESFVNMYMGSLVNKIIYEDDDLPKVFSIGNADTLKRILRIVASHPGIITDYASLSNDLGISRKTLSKYISYLEMGFLIHKCLQLLKEPSDKRKEDEETVSVKHDTAIFVVRRAGLWQGGFNVDCIFLKDGSVVPVESKYSGNIRKKDIKGLMKFLKDFSVDAGYVVTIDAEADEMMGGRQVVFMPLWRWLLRN